MAKNAMLTPIVEKTHIATILPILIHALPILATTVETAQVALA